MPALDYQLVADIYDRFVKTDLDVQFFREECKRTHGQVLELMCGTGRLTLPLLADGVSLTCVDSSPEMLAPLRMKLTRLGHAPEIVEQDITRLSLSNRFNLAIIPFNSFSEITSDADQINALSSIRNHLSVQGRIIVTLHNPTVRLKHVDGHPHKFGPMPVDEMGEILTLALTETYDDSTGLVTGVEIFTAHDSTGRQLWQREIPLSFRLLSLEAFEALSGQVGLSIEAVYGDYDRSLFNSTTSPFIICSLVQSTKRA